MTRDEITDLILDAMEILAEGKVEEAGGDQTVEAVVIRCLSYATGEYIVKYSGGTFSAYAKDLNKIYQPDSIVNVLIPKGDNSRIKIILNEVLSYKEKTIEGENIADILTVEPIGTNICQVLDAEDSCWSFSTEDRSDEHILYGEGIVGEEKIKIDSTLATYYLLPSKYIQLSADFRTEIPAAKQKTGNFGIECIVTFINPLAGNETNNTIDRTYILDINNMIGTPYTQIDNTPQEAHFLIDGTNFVRIKSVRLFCKDFNPNNGGGTPGTGKKDIFISNLAIRGMVDLEKDINGYSLRILSQQDPYTESLNTINLQAEVFKDYKYQNINNNTAECYWFKENYQVTNTSDSYLECGGPGWECLNTYSQTEDNRFYNTGSSFIEIPSSRLNAKETRIKCVIKFKNTDIILTKQTTVINLMNQYSLNLISSEGEKTFKDTTTITAEITPNDGRNFTYNWSYEVDDKLLQTVDITENVLEIDLTQAVNHIKIYCTVKDADFGDEVVINSIIVERVPEEPVIPYTLTILNGDQVFRYDANGISPAAPSNAIQQTIKPLEIQLVNEEGEVVSNDNLSYEWVPPLEISGTLIKDFQDNLDGTATFNIDTHYNMNLLNNTIKVIVHYNNVVMEAQTNFFFIRDGENGANGTSTQIRVVPNISSGLPEGTIAYWYKRGNVNPLPNYNYTGNPIKIQMYKDGELYYDSIDDASDTEKGVTFKYDILKRQYSSTSEDKTHFKIGTTVDQILSFDTNQGTEIGATLGEYRADIIKAEVTYDNNKFYYYYPIPYILYNKTGFQIKIKPNTGFTEVMYSEDGKNPLYRGTSQFEIEVYKNGTIYTNIDEINSVYSTVGQIKNKNDVFIPDENIVVDTLHNFSPKETYDGNCVTNAAIITLVDAADSQEIATIHIPIVLYLNTYGNKHINDWDGVSLTLDNKGGVALMPQLVAGSKNNTNSFTGIVGGKVKDNDTTQAQDQTTGFKHGLFGYNNGQQTFALNAVDGSATFGKTGAGQIILNPGADTAIIKSGNYIAGTSGMQIDLSTPSINWGNNNFSVDANGIVHAVNGVFSGTITAGSGSNIAGFEITSSSIKKESNDWRVEIRDPSQYPNSDFLTIYDKINNKWPFVIRANGYMTLNGATVNGIINAASGNIGGWTINDKKLTATAPNNKVAVVQTPFSNTANVFAAGGSSHDSYADCPFRVRADGHLFATSATISGDITATSGTIGNCSIVNGTLKVTNANISGTINANHININDLFAQNINASGTITGAKIKGGSISSDTTITGASISGSSFSTSGVRISGTSMEITTSGNIFIRDSGGTIHHGVNDTINIIKGNGQKGKLMFMNGLLYGWE